jgi:hypothetical protein
MKIGKIEINKCIFCGKIKILSCLGACQKCLDYLDADNVAESQEEYDFIMDHLQTADIMAEYYKKQANGK